MKILFTCLFLCCTCFAVLSFRFRNSSDSELLAIEDGVSARVRSWTKLAETGKFNELHTVREELDAFISMNLPRVQKIGRRALQQNVLHHLEYLRKASPEILKPFEEINADADNNELSRLALKINNFCREEERTSVKIALARKN